MQTLVPELTLQPAAQFTKTAIAKNVAGCVRLTKNLPLSKASPMSHYLAGKGSTAWEAAVKQQKGAREEDGLQGLEQDKHGQRVGVRFVPRLAAEEWARSR